MAGLERKDLSDVLTSVVQVEIPSQEEYDAILNDMILAFYQKSDKCQTKHETEIYCRKLLESAMNGFLMNGQIWKTAPGKKGEHWREILKKRLKIYRYDIDERARIVGHENTVAKIRDKYKKNKPSNRESKKFNRGEAPIEDDPGKLTFDEQRMMAEFEKELKEKFPSQITPGDELLIRRLSYYKVRTERDIAEGTISKISDEMTRLLDTLGISGKQRIKLSDQDKSGTLDQAIEIYKETKQAGLDMERLWLWEELKMLSNATKRNPNEWFLYRSYIKRIFGDEIDGKPITPESLEKYLKDNKPDVRN